MIFSTFDLNLSSLNFGTLVKGVFPTVASIMGTAQGGPNNRHKVNDTIILQPYVIESCGFQQNVSKEILYMT